MTMAANMVTSKTLVIIISDGWDTGDTAVLDSAMAQLRRMALRVIWLNPLLGSANYQPLPWSESAAGRPDARRGSLWKAPAREGGVDRR